MKTMKKIATIVLIAYFLLSPKVIKEASALSIFGFNFTEDGWNAAMLSILTSIEALNEVANSRIFDLFGEVKQLKSNADKVIKAVNQVRNIYGQGERVYHLTAAGYALYAQYLETAAEITTNSEILSSNEIRYMLRITEYAAFDITKAFGIGNKKTSENVAGGILTELTEMLNLIFESGTDQAAKNTKDLLDATERRLKDNLQKMDIAQKYAHGIIQKRKLEKGIFDYEKVRQALYNKKYKDRMDIINNLKD